MRPRRGRVKPSVLGRTPRRRLGGCASRGPISHATMATAMQITVEGEDISPDEFNNGVGWTSSVNKRKSASTDVPEQGDRASSTLRGGNKGAAPASVKKRINAASRLPRLPKEHIRIVVRPRGGLDIRKVGHLRVAQALITAANLQETDVTEDIICPNMMQNIMVASTPLKRNAMAYAGVKGINIGQASYEVNAYFAAPENSCKGVIRGIDPAIEHQELQRLIVQPKNPTALEVRRIKNTSTVVILFDGLKVPDYVKYGPSLVKCSLYRRHTDICYACGRLGHRADVCPAPEDVICRGCGESNPDNNHDCSPKCTLCGGPHMTADKTCKQRYQMPFLVRQRRRERRKRGDGGGSNTCSGHTSRSRSRDRGGAGNESRGRSKERSSSKGRKPSRTRYGSRGRSRSRSKGPPAVRIQAPASSSSSQGTNWADRVRDSPPPPPRKVTRGVSPEHDRIAQLEKENALLRQAVEQLRSEIAALKTEDRKTVGEGDSHPEHPPPPVVEVPMEVPIAESVPCVQSKRRALSQTGGQPKGVLSSRIAKLENATDSRFEKIEQATGEMRVILDKVVESIQTLVARCDRIDTAVSNWCALQGQQASVNNIQHGGPTQ